MSGLTPEEMEALWQVYEDAGITPPSGSTSSGSSGGSWWDAILDNSGDILGGAWDWLTSDTGTAVGGIGGGLLAAYLASQQDDPAPSGYQGGIPEYTYNRQQIQRPVDPNRRPGSGGRRYFTEGTYSGGGGGGMPAPSGIATQAQPPIAGADTGVPAGGSTVPNENRTQPAEPSPREDSVFAEGGLASLTGSGYLRGDTKGMEDKIQTSIDGKDPAALSHGEYVIPADVVAYLGQGNNEAGAKEFDRIIASIRKKAIGSDKQIKPVDTGEIMSRLA